MKSITIRGVDSVLAEKMKQTALDENQSVNQLVLDVLQEHFGLKKQKRFTKVHRDMDHLFGRWSEEEFQQIQGKIDEERVIDPELWK